MWDRRLAMIIWITGRKHSGKTTLAYKLKEQLGNCVVLDGDEIREITGNELYTDSSRIRNQRIITKFAKMLVGQGVENIIIACVSPVKNIRESFQHELGAIEIQLPFGELWEGTKYEE